MPPMKFRVHILMSFMLEAPDAERAKHLAYLELEQVAQNEKGRRPTLRVVSVWDAEQKEERR
jgi:hypothetical protein